MKFVRNPNHFVRQAVQPVVAIGNFDGMHRGHQRLIQEAKSVAKTCATASLLLTFEPLPHEFFQKPIARIMPLREKIQYCAQQGLDFFCCLRFDQELSQYSPEKFVQFVLIEQLQVHTVIIGEDFQFGYRRTGNIALLRQFEAAGAFKVKVVPHLKSQGQKIGSSWLRRLIEEGSFAEYEGLCGHPFTLSGKVITGQKLGRQLGFPTANLRLKNLLDYPLSGVYGVSVRLPHLTDWWPGAMNVGLRPTVQGVQRQLEIHLLDFQGDLYGQRLMVKPHYKVRAEQLFPDLNALKQRIDQDIEIIKSRLITNERRDVL